MISCNIFPPFLLFHCHVVMKLISHKCCSFRIVAHKSSPCFKPDAFLRQYSTLSLYLLKVALSEEQQDYEPIKNISVQKEKTKNNQSQVQVYWFL